MRSDIMNIKYMNIFQILSINVPNKRRNFVFRVLFLSLMEKNVWFCLFIVIIINIYLGAYILSYFRS
jgi:hypothetical protein